MSGDHKSTEFLENIVHRSLMPGYRERVLWPIRVVHSFSGHLHVHAMVYDLFTQCWYLTIVSGNVL